MVRASEVADARVETVRASRVSEQAREASVSGGSGRGEGNGVGKVG